MEASIHPSSIFLFYSGPQWIGGRPAVLVRAIFPQSMDSNADIFRRHPLGHVLPAIWAFLRPVRLTHEIKHHSDHNNFDRQDLGKIL